MATKRYNINGKVIDKTNKTPLAFLTIEAWDKDLLIDNALGKTQTDRSGKFTINFDQKYYQELFFDRKPDIYFNIYKDSELIYSTKKDVLWNVTEAGKEIVIEVPLVNTRTEKSTNTLTRSLNKPSILNIPRIEEKSQKDQNIALLQNTLTKLGYSVTSEEIKKKKAGKTTIEALAAFQKINNINPSGKLDADTINILNSERENIHFTTSKTRISKLQDMLERLGYSIDKKEKIARKYGETTQQALNQFARNEGIRIKDGKINEDLVDKLSQQVIKKRYTTKTQIGNLQNQLIKALKIAKLDLNIADKELKGKEFGKTTANAIKSFQAKYNLPATGELNALTLEKIDSVAFSRGVPVQRIAKPAKNEIRQIKSGLSINKKSQEVSNLQNALAYMGYVIDKKEFNTSTFGKTTEKAVKQFQKSNFLIADGKVGLETKKALNSEIGKINPDAIIDQAKTYRIRGSVRNQLLERTGNMVIKVYEHKLNGTNSEPLATKKNHQTGFFDFSYAAPIDPITGQIKANFHLEVKLFDSVEKLVSSRIIYNVARIQWVNFNLADEPYRGVPLYFSLYSELSKKLEGKALVTISETEENAQITLLSKETGIPKESVMRMVFSELVAKEFNHPNLTPEVLFAFIKQNFPPRLSGNLLEAVMLWENIDPVVEDAASGLAFSDEESVSQVIDSAIKGNLVSISVKQNKQKILDALSLLRNTFTLEKPILTGNGTLKSILDESVLKEEKYSTVSTSFINNGGTSPSFWTDLEANGFSKQEITGLKSTMDLAFVTKSHIHTLQVLQLSLGDVNNTNLTQTSDVAKLSVNDWKTLITNNGSQVPDNMPGDNTDEKITNYAITLETNASRLFPSVSLVAKIKQSGKHNLTKIDDIESFMDSNIEMDFKRTNIDKYAIDHNLELVNTLADELKMVQRIHKLSLNSTSGSGLMAENLTNSYQIYRTGKNRLISKLKKQGVEKNSATKIYERAKSQYAQILARFFKFSPAVNKDTPQAIQQFKYDSDELKNLISDVPSLEALFGSMDSCECKHCQSLYGPAAYFTDLLRFLGEHDSLVEQSGDLLSVQQILLDRRPDLGNIKLNCQNTHTAMPYIDLVCEILENNNDPQQKDFSYQTTLSTEELEAIPQYIRPHAYEVLANANYPMNNSFNLWQEEIRLNLEHFKAPRWKLMEIYQNKANPVNPSPSDINIAAEYFGISTHELSIITTAAATKAHQDTYWGIDTSQTSVTVEEFLSRTNLTYYQLLELLMTKFVNDPEAPNPMEINRPSDTCDLSTQMIVNLTIERFDLIHRFLRLWRKTPWEIWELDYLMMNAKVGNENMNDTGIIHLMQFHQLQTKLDLGVEVLLSFYGDLLTDTRIQPDNPKINIPSLYEKHFQNLTITNPTDSRFEFDLDGSVALETDPVSGYTPIPTILSALAISQESYDELADKTDGTLTLESLSILFRYSYLSKGLRKSVKNMVAFFDAAGIVNPFQSLENTLNLIEQLDLVDENKMKLPELEYMLHFDVDSVKGLREESIIQYLESVRSTIAKNQETLEQLDISNAQLTNIKAVDTATLTGLSAADALIAIAALQTALNELSENFTAASFAVNELNYIVAFADNSAFSVDTLVDNIDSLQIQINDLYHNGTNQIVSLVAGMFGFGEQVMEVILTNTNTPGTSNLLVKTLGDLSILDLDSEGTYVEITSTAFPDHFLALKLIHKISVLQEHLNFEAKDLEWFIVNHTAVSTLDYGSLPVDTGAADASFDNLINLYRFYRFITNYPEPEEASLIEILDLAIDGASNKADILSLIAELTQWDEADVEAMDSGFGLQHTAVNLDYAVAENYDRLVQAMKLSRLVGVDVATLFAWAERDDLNQQKQIALQTRYAIKSKYEGDAWLDKITPIQNELRKRKRSSLVEYHLENSQRNQSKTLLYNGDNIPNPLYWKDSNAMYKYFLIDVEMGPDQLTSRLKQAISSVQLFVQRCFLNLEQRYVQVSQAEKADVASENAWSQWKWMKNYRIWEANRKVFFYPENWIEPELRDDKSPFFKELEEELMQGEITNDNVEAAFLNYLHKVDEVSNLYICGVYHEYEDLNEEYEGYEINIVHVIARTKDDPAIYYYRTYDLNYSTWTAWEKIDVEITGDHAVPVVYNRKLHIFWLTFIEKPIKMAKSPAASASSGPTDSPDAPKMLEMQLGWTIKKTTGWTPKSISKKKLIHPWERPHFSYHLKPFYKSYTNELWLDIYITTSKEFNDRKFYDPYWKTSSGKFAKLTHVDFNETYRPWHSSSFIFDGKVKEIKMNALSGQYRLMALNDPSGNNLSNTDSVAYVQSNFSEDGRAIQKFTTYDDGPKLELPNGMHYHNNHLRNNLNNKINKINLNILENNSTIALLKGANSPFEMIIDHQDIPFDALNTDHPFLYQDSKWTLFIKPEWLEHFDEYGNLTGKTRQYEFSSFYHPYTTLFIRELNRNGIDGLLTRDIQTKPASFPPGNSFSFYSEFAPNSKVSVHENIKNDIVDFSLTGAYSIYNWEIFFHAPLMIANRLMQNQRFEEAMQWFHYIFNPTNIDSVSSPQRYWITKPFFENNDEDYKAQQISNILLNIDSDESQKQLLAWRNDPFKPHLIARYRPVAYQKNVVMKYLDNLIAWGDQLFMRDTMESINEASMLYMLAYEILGDRPQSVPNVEHDELTFNELPNLDSFGNARVDIAIEDTLLPIKVVGAIDGSEPLPNLETWYYGIPGNDFILKYWDTVEDRLFKIRNSMNIQGVKRSLALFAPPIDPALLVKAAAAGIDLSTVLNDITTGTPHYRFKLMLQYAVEFCSDVKQLGDKLLSALEKRDAEELAQLRSQHEIELLKGIKIIKKKRIDEAKETASGLELSKEMAETKKAYYESKDYMNTGETIGFALNTASTALDAAIAIGYILSGGLKLIPDILIGAAGFGGSPEASATTGGKSFGSSAEDAVKTLSSIATALQKGAGLANTQGSYMRRWDDWMHQKELAQIEIGQVEYQINAAQIRQAIAEQDLTNQETQIENAEEVFDYMKNKYTNKQLYNWMVSKISGTYFQAYQLAYEMAKKAEKCYQHELGIENTSFIQFGYWDSLKKGLLSGEQLLLDLRRMEASYLDQNKRELEITKHISLAQISPLSLLGLKQNGECLVTLPEWLFDMDYPGHYMRRIKSFSISIPCVTGPYVSINCTVTLLKHEMRLNAMLSGGNYEKQDADDDRFRTKFGPVSSIATSHGQADNGMFELTFNDERYLPFEGAGLDSEWKISLPADNNYFDFSTISDVILHINYTARNGGDSLTTGARNYVNSLLPENSFKLFSLKHEFPNEWYKMLHATAGSDQEFAAQLTSEHYPYFLRNKLNTWKIQKIEWFIQSQDSGDFTLLTDVMAGVYDSLPGQAISPSTDYDGMHEWKQDLTATTPSPTGTFRFKLEKPGSGDFQSLTVDDIDNIFMVFYLG